METVSIWIGGWTVCSVLLAAALARWTSAMKQERSAQGWVEAEMPERFEHLRG